jgi:hypothetical protein
MEANLRIGKYMRGFAAVEIEVLGWNRQFHA